MCWVTGCIESAQRAYRGRADTAGSHAWWARDRSVWSTTLDRDDAAYVGPQWCRPACTARYRRRRQLARIYRPVAALGRGVPWDHGIITALTYVRRKGNRSVGDKAGVDAVDEVALVVCE